MGYGCTASCLPPIFGSRSCIAPTITPSRECCSSVAGRHISAALARFIRDAAYEASVELSREKGAFPLFDADKYLAAPSFASRLPSQVKQAIRVHGVRNSHLLAIAPTGTISLAFADNASNGIEPPFSWCYTRKKRMPDDTKKEYLVEDHAYRL